MNNITLSEKYTLNQALDSGLANIYGLKKCGKQYQGACPICGGDDRFHVKSGNDGYLHVHCRHGCTQSDLFKKFHSDNALPKTQYQTSLVAENVSTPAVLDPKKAKLKDLGHFAEDYCFGIMKKAALLADYDQSNTSSSYHLEQNKIADELRQFLEKVGKDYSEPELVRESGTITLDDYLSLPQPPQLISNLAPATGVGFIAGKTGSGKSHFLLALARACQNGWSIDQFQWNRKGRTLFVLIEDIHGFSRRWSASNEFFDQKLDAKLFYPAENFALDSGTGVNDLIDCAIKEEYSQIVIETFALAKGRWKENDNDEMTAAIKQLYRIARETNTFVWVSHHSPHTDPDRERGASAMRANVDVSIGLKLSGQSMTVKIAKNKLGPQDITFLLELTHGNHHGNFHAIPCIDPRKQSGNLKKLAKLLWDELKPNADAWWNRIDTEFPEGQRPAKATKSKWFKEFSGETFQKYKETPDNQRKVSITPPLKGSDGNSFESHSKHWQEENE